MLPYQVLLRGLPLLTIQTLGLAVILTAFWFFAGLPRGKTRLALAGLASALIAYSPFIALAALFARSAGWHGLVGMAALFTGMALFIWQTLQARRLMALVALGPMLAFSTFTFFMLATVSTGF